MRRHFRGTVRLKNLSQSGHWPSGNPRYYYRKKGYKAIRMPDAPTNSPEFRKAHAEAELSLSKSHQGSIARGIDRFRKSPDFTGLAANTKDRLRRDMNDIAQRYGEGSLSTLRPSHIRKDISRLTPHPANNRLKTWRALCKYWVKVGMMERNPAKEVERHEIPKSEGYPAWTREDRDQFRATYDHSSPERFAFELMYRTCASIGDACLLGPHMVDGDGWLPYTRQKSSTVATCPFLTPGPDWFEADGHLEQCLKAHPRHMRYIVTKAGHPRSTKSAAAWFSRVCTRAGLPTLSAHGIRKLRAAMFRENGASEDQRMAILGHESKQMASHYSKSADLRKVISGTNSSNPGFQLDPTVVKFKGKSDT